MQFVKYLFLGALLLLIITLLVFMTSSKLSMDRDLVHTKTSKNLPKFDPSTDESMVNISSRNMTFRARIAGFNGDESKPVIILLHGFPVTSAMWIDLITPLKEAGYRVVAFDQRGYSPEARPSDLDSYTIPQLTNDVFAIADAIGAKKFHLVGHDWGAVVGWSAVLSSPSRVVSWTALSIAHPAAFGAALQDDPDQQSRSSYFAFFQTPWLPETVFSFNNFRVLKTLYKGMKEEQQEEYIDVFSEPRALTLALNWYRSIGKNNLINRDTNLNLDVLTPTLFIWGNQDQAVGRVATESMTQFMKGPYTNIELEAGHWLFVDEPDRVIHEILFHINQYKI